jgi:hypothetical protein
VSAAPGLRCPACAAAVASPADELAIDGAVRHRLGNRAGATFEVACFERAPGAAASGPATDDDTWFPGHTWQRAFCRGCSGHVGWLFRGKARVFFGLVEGAATGAAKG